MRTSILYLIIAFSLITSSAFGQARLYQAGELSENSVFIQQVGAINNVQFIQSGGHENGDNHSAVLQLGRQNLIDFSGEGSFITAGLMQGGNGNQMILDLQGNRIAGSVIQIGKGNLLDLDISENNFNFEYLQRGHNHELVVREGFSSSLPGLSVKQQGMTGLRVIITK